MTGLRTVQGMGVNDADYVTQPTINGIQVTCPFYKAWHDMLNRCYNTKRQVKKPTYIVCTVTEKWLLFSNFRNWMTGQDWRGKQLDKDLLFAGNKVYSPETCIFVLPQINTLLCDRAADRGEYPIGVTKQKNRFTARCNANGVRVYLGRYSTPEEASQVYRSFKSNHVTQIAMEQTEPLRSALLRVVI